MNDNSRRNKWNSLLRFGAFVAALGGMYISAQFSVRGFEFSVSGTAWVGWAIAGIIIVLESIWQKFGQNRTLFAIAVGCYGYGIVTNVVGIVQAKGGYSNVNWLDYLVAIFFGVLFEVFPEPVLAWAISGDVSSDPLGKFVDGLVEDSKPQQFNNQKKHIYMPIQAKSSKKYVPQHKPAHLVTPNIQRAKQGISPVPSSQPLRPAPAYHPVGMSAQANKTYPRPSAYIQAIQEMEDDGEFDIAEGG